MAILTFEFEMKANCVKYLQSNKLFEKKREREKDGEAYRQTAINDDDDDLTMLIGPLRQNCTTWCKIRGWGSIKILINDWSR